MMEKSQSEEVIGLDMLPDPSADPAPVDAAPPVEPRVDRRELPLLEPSEPKLKRKPEDHLNAIRQLAQAHGFELIQPLDGQVRTAIKRAGQEAEDWVIRNAGDDVSLDELEDVSNAIGLGVRWMARVEQIAEGRDDRYETILEMSERRRRSLYGRLYRDFMYTRLTFGGMQHTVNAPEVVFYLMNYSARELKRTIKRLADKPGEVAEVVGDQINGLRERARTFIRGTKDRLGY